MKLIGSDIERNINEVLKSYLPQYYNDFKVVQEILNVDSAEMEDFHSHLSTVIEQFYVNTATWGLDTWERICNLPIRPPGKDYLQRRSIIISKLRGFGVVNKDLIRNIAESFINGEVEVNDRADFYDVVITFVGKRGMPSDMEDIKKAIREIVPAHLGLIYLLTWLSWLEVENNKLRFRTISEILTWEQFETLTFRSWYDVRINTWGSYSDDTWGNLNAR